MAIIILITMNIKTTHLDHDMLKSCYAPVDVSTTIMCNKCVFGHEYIDKTLSFGEKNIILKFAHNKSAIIGLHIESKNVCECFIIMYNFVISHFHVAKGKQYYPLLVLQLYSCINIMIDKCSILNLEILSINKFNSNAIILPYEKQRTPNHIIVKMNEFGPPLMYHNGCNCGPFCSFYNCDNVFDFNRYNIKSFDIIKCHPSIITSKIKGICKRIILLFNTELITDLVVYIGMMMLSII